MEFDVEANAGANIEANVELNAAVNAEANASVNVEANAAVNAGRNRNIIAFAVVAAALITTIGGLIPSLLNHLAPAASQPEAGTSQVQSTEITTLSDPTLHANKPTSFPKFNLQPTPIPTSKPTFKPSLKLETNPASYLALTPTFKPSSKLTRNPTPNPTLKTTTNPTLAPTLESTHEPTSNPTLKSTSKPTPRPSYKPTLKPTYKPSSSILLNLLLASPPTLKPIQRPTLKLAIFKSAKRVTILTASNGQAYDEFSYSVAIDDSTLIVGVWRDDSAYIYSCSGNSWLLKEKLVTNHCEEDDCPFGESVAISSDTIVIGARDGKHNGVFSGAVYVYNRIEEYWVFDTKLLPFDSDYDDEYGSSVDIDGDTIIVGAFGDNTNGNWTGSAYVYTRIDGLWTFQTKLIPKDGNNNINFGMRVAINKDTAVIGALWDGSGSAYIYSRADNVWSLQAKI